MNEYDAILRSLARMYENLICNTLNLTRYRGQETWDKTIESIMCDDYYLYKFKERKITSISMEYHKALMSALRLSDGHSLSFNKELDKRYNYKVSQSFFKKCRFIKSDANEQSREEVKELPIVDFDAIKQYCKEVKAAEEKENPFAIGSKSKMLNELQKMINPTFFIASFLYMKYHQYYDEEMFVKFCNIIGVNNNYGIDNMHIACITSIGYVEELMNKVKESLKGRVDYLYNTIYADLFETSKIYENIKYFAEEIDEFKDDILGEVFTDITDNYHPTGTKVMPSDIDEYLKRVENAIQKNYRIMLTDERMKKMEGDVTSYQIRTESGHIMMVLGFFDKRTELIYCMKSKYSELIEKVKINKEKKLCKIHKYGNNEKESVFSLEKENIKILGEMYCLFLVLLAFSKNNLRSKEIEKVVKKSLKKDKIYTLLKSYVALIDDNELYTNLINEIIAKECN